MTWARGRDEVQRLIDDEEVEIVEASTDVAERLMHDAEAHVRLAGRGLDDDPAGALQLSYDAARKASAALLAAQGLRATTARRPHRGDRRCPGPVQRPRRTPSIRTDQPTPSPTQRHRIPVTHHTRCHDRRGHPGTRHRSRHDRRSQEAPRKRSARRIHLTNRPAKPPPSSARQLNEFTILCPGAECTARFTRILAPFWRSH